MTITVVGLFKDIREVDSAIKALKNQGFDLTQISLKTGDEVVNRDIETDAANRELAAAITYGAITGAALGVLIGTIWGLASIPLPGSNPGVTLQALQTLLSFVAAGAVIGAAVGGFLLGSLVTLGFASEKGRLHITGFRQKGVMVAVQTPEERVTEVKNVLHEANAIEGTVS